MNSKTGANTQFRPLWLTIGWALIFLIIYLSLTRNPVSVPVEQGDKIGHVLAYSVLMLWFSQLCLSKKRRVLLAMALIALGVAMEFAQLLLTDYRTFEIADMVADGVGVALGWLIAPPRAPHLLKLVDAGMVAFLRRGK